MIDQLFFKLKNKIQKDKNIDMDGQTGGRTDWTDRHTDRQTDRHVQRLIYK